MFQAFGFSLLILLILYAFLLINNRRATRRTASAPSSAGVQSVPATFVMKTVDAHNSANSDDLLVFSLADGTRLTFCVAQAQTGDWPVSGRGTLTYLVQPNGVNEWISFAPDAPDAAEQTAPATVVRLDSSDSSALFALPDGSRVRLCVPPVAFALLREGLAGQLTWQAQSLVLFTPAQD